MHPNIVQFEVFGDYALFSDPVMRVGGEECQGSVSPCQFGAGEGAYDGIDELAFGLMYHGITYADEAWSEETKDRMTANDSSGFTFRGRFTEARQAAIVSYAASQKAHNALTWIAANRGVVVAGRTFICWNPQGKTVYPPLNPL